MKHVQNAAWIVLLTLGIAVLEHHIEFRVRDYLESVATPSVQACKPVPRIGRN